MAPEDIKACSPTTLAQEAHTELFINVNGKAHPKKNVIAFRDQDFILEYNYY